MGEIEIGLLPAYRKSDKKLIFIPDEERFDYDLDPDDPLPGQEELELIDDNPETTSS